ncbi:porin [Labrys miyagiensis]
MRIKLFVLTTAMVCPVFSTLAADLAAQQPDYEPQAVYSTYDWSGLYVGLHGGYSWSRLTQEGAKENVNRGSTGLHAGYNFQYGNLVFGFENDLNYIWSDGKKNGNVSLDWDGSARGRLGYAWDRTLFYGTAGVAGAYGAADRSRLGKVDKTLVGWTAGAGVEHALTDNISVSAEYRFADFGSADLGRALGKVEVDQHAVTLGASYKF